MEQHSNGSPGVMRTGVSSNIPPSHMSNILANDHSLSAFRAETTDEAYTDIDPSSLHSNEPPISDTENTGFN